MKFSIITPTFNSAKYLRETVESVLSQQGDFEIEYIIIDNCSTDGTLDIVKNYDTQLRNGHYNIKFKKLFFTWLSEKDQGMYDAINRGFRMATGDIFAWLNADDVYLPGAFEIVQRTFQKYPQIDWLKGITSYINEKSAVTEMGNCLLYERDWIRKGVYGVSAYFIQQDSVFWRSHLWKRAGEINNELKLAGDFYLWQKFANYAQLYSIKSYLSCFRKNPGQLSQNHSAYQEECASISSPNKIVHLKAKFFFKIERALYCIMFKRAFSRAFLGKQNFMLIELDSKGEPVLRLVHYYLG